eukprot:403347378
MEDGELEQFKGQFEFHNRRAITEAAPHRAACRYDSADDNDEEELALNNGDFFDLNMLPDQMPQDLYSQNNANNNSKQIEIQNFRNYKDQEPPLRLGKNMRGSTQGSARDHIALGKPLKPQTFGQNSQVPGKVFGSSVMPLGSNSGYNSQKNLRNKAEYCNQTVNGPANYGNNRYSSQNMKGTSDFDDDDEQIDEVENGLEVAEENCGVSNNGGVRSQVGNGFASHLQTEIAFSESAPETLSQTYRRGSHRYKDRINTIRMQSKETYQREHMVGPTYFTEINERQSNQVPTNKNGQGDNDGFDIFERAQQDNIYSQRSRYQNYQHSNNITNHNLNYNETQINYAGDYSELEMNGQKSLFKSRYDNPRDNNANVQSKRWTTQPDANDVQVRDYQDEENQEYQGLNFQGQFDDHEERNEDDDATPKQDMSQMYVDPKSGAHFQYRELIKRLSDMTNSSKDKNSSRKSQVQKGKVKQCETDLRIPLKEKTQEIVNQQQITSSQKKKKFSAIDPSGKMRPYCNSAKPTKKDTKKVNTQENQNPIKAPLNHQIGQNIVSQSKINKLLLISNQENHFIDKKLKDLQNIDPQLNLTRGNNLSKNLTINQNKSHKNLHKSIEKTFTKISSQQQQCQINNMKLNKASMASVKQASNAPIQTSNNSHKNQSASSQHHQQIIINNILSNNALSSSISSSSTGGATSTNFAINGLSSQQILGSASGTFSSGGKCPSSNLLRTATTAAFTTTTTNKSSAKLTQCNSNKQINNKETPEATARQKYRLTGTTLSSTSKRNNLNSAGGGTTLSNNSQGNTIQNSHNNMHAVIQQQFGYQDSGNKLSQNSEQKDQQNITNKSHNGISAPGQVNSGTNTHPSSVPRSSSSNKKLSVQKMVKNQSFLKCQKENMNKKQTNNEFYNTVLQNLQNGKLGLTSLTSTGGQSQMNINLKSNPHQQIMNSHLTQNIHNHIQPRLSDSKKQSLIGQSSKTTRVSGVNIQGSQLASAVSITNPPSKPQSRLSQGKKTATNQKDFLTGNQTNNNNIESGMSQISNNIKRISDMLQAHQQSPTSQNDYYSRKNSNKTLKDESELQQNQEKSILGKQATLGNNAQKFNQFFMKINQEQQQYLANQSQIQLKPTQGSSTSLNQHSILLNHQVNKSKHTAQLLNNRVAFSNTSSTLNTGRPFSGNSNYENEKVNPQQTQVQRKISQEKNQQVQIKTNMQQEIAAGQDQIMHTQQSRQDHQVQMFHNMTQSQTNQQQQQQQSNYQSYSQAYLQTQTSTHTSQQNQPLNSNNLQDHDNRQSLQVQHKTIEKKTALTAQQQALQQKLTQNRNQYLQQKKEELAQATMKTLNSKQVQRNNNNQQDQSAINNQQNKKGFLMANIKIPKGVPTHHRQQQQTLMTQDAYERMHLPTEEDDYCNPSHLNGGGPGAKAQQNLITNSQFQQHHTNQVMTEVFQLNNLMETEGDQYDIYNCNKSSSHLQNHQHLQTQVQERGVVNGGSYLAQHQQTQKYQANQSTRYGNPNISHSNTINGGSKHSVKVKPKHF